jgi:two-component system, OmpR family, alkaline phosphatase synthesis response regulator PhoP
VRTVRSAKGSAGRQHLERILLVQDDVAVASALEDLLASEGYETKTIRSGVEGQGEAERGQYRLLILDVQLPGRDGYQVCRNLRERGVDVPILMLSARDTNLDIVLGLRLGADEFLAKPFDGQVFLAKVLALLRRANGGDGPAAAAASGAPRRFRFGDFEFDAEAAELRRGGVALPLSAQEYHLLRFLATHPHRVFSRDELLTEAWGYALEPTTRTVDVHVSGLRQKLGREEGRRHLVTVRGLGYKFVPDPDS